MGILESLPGDRSVTIAINLGNLAEIYAETGRDEALDTNRRALEIYERDALKHPHGPHARQRLLSCRTNEGDILRRLDRRRDAEVALRRAVSEAEKLIADFPDVPDYRAEAASALTLEGEVLRRLDRHRDAEEATRRAVSLAERLIADFPELPDYRAVAADAFRERALSLVGSDRPGEVRGAFERALSAAEALVAAHPDRHDYREQTLAPTCAAIAEYYACGAAPEHRDPARAAAAARRAIEVAPKGAAHWTVLGLAEYRAGNWDAAIKAAGKGLELRGAPGSAYDWTVLALAHGKRGEMGIAREWFAKAPPRPQLGRLADPPLSLYDEAVTLLGGEGQTPRPERTPDSGTEPK